MSIMAGVPAHPPAPPEIPDTPTAPDIQPIAPPEWPAGDPPEAPDVSPPIESPPTPEEMPADMADYSVFASRWFLNPVNFPVR